MLRAKGGGWGTIGEGFGFGVWVDDGGERGSDLGLCRFLDAIEVPDKGETGNVGFGGASFFQGKVLGVSKMEDFGMGEGQSEDSASRLVIEGNIFGQWVFEHVADLLVPRGQLKTSAYEVHECWVGRIVGAREVGDEEEVEELDVMLGTHRVILGATIGGVWGSSEWVL